VNWSRSAEAAWEEAQDIGLPVVVKPVRRQPRRGVSLNLMTESDVTAAYVLAAARARARA
jgi:cyanophycin synthetase